jgi:hypothetical protein
MLRFSIRDVLWLAAVVASVAVQADEPGPMLKELVKRVNDNSSNSAVDAESRVCSST